MDQDRPLARRGNLKLVDEASSLYIVRSAIVIVIEADFAAGDDFRLGEQCVEVGQSGFIGFRDVVGIDSRTGVELGKTSARLAPGVEFAADVERLMHFGRPLANANREDDADACLPRAHKHRLTIVRVARAVKVGMRVDQQLRLKRCMEIELQGPV